MFFLNVGYQWKVASSMDDLQAAIFLASGSYSERLLRSKTPEFQRLILDPQLYLAGLNVEGRTKTCARLASFPWFCVPDLPAFESSSEKRSEWQKGLQEKITELWPGKAPEGDDVMTACESAIDFQVELACTHVILPSPLITEREDESETQALWIDAGLRAASESEVAQPLLATVALTESCINQSAFDEGGFLDTIVDQVSSRDGLSGVYVVVAQTAANHPFLTDSLVHRAYLHLCREFAGKSYDFVIPNFADVQGLACMGVGATSFATGPSHSLRRLSLAAFKDEGGGTPLPTLYSQKSIGEFLTETDLDTIVSNRLFSRVRDSTSFSEPLIEELSAGGSASNIPAWAENKGNMAASHRHFIQRLMLEERRARRARPNARQEHIRDWLETGAANQLYVEERLKKSDDSLRGRLAPAQRWLDCFDQCSSDA